VRLKRSSATRAPNVLRINLQGLAKLDGRWFGFTPKDQGRSELKANVRQARRPPRRLLQLPDGLGYLAALDERTGEPEARLHSAWVDLDRGEVLHDRVILTFVIREELRETDSQGGRPGLSVDDRAVLCHCFVGSP
jgi:hypothetical protein